MHLRVVACDWLPDRPVGTLSRCYELNVVVAAYRDLLDRLG